MRVFAGGGVAVWVAVGLAVAVAVAVGFAVAVPVAVAVGFSVAVGAGVAVVDVQPATSAITVRTMTNRGNMRNFLVLHYFV